MAMFLRRRWVLAVAGITCLAAGLVGCYENQYGAMYPQTTYSSGYAPNLGPRSGSTPNGYLPQTSPTTYGVTHSPIVQASAVTVTTQEGDPVPAPQPRNVPGGYPGNAVEMPMGPFGAYGDTPPPVGPAGCPKELRPVSHPPYTISPPDILFLDAIRLIPKSPYRLEALEVLLLSVTDTLPNAPIVGQYVISPEGMLSLGYNYGAVRVGGLTLDQAQTAIRTHLSKILRNPQVTMALAQFRGIQQVRGQHLVRPDGTIGLGTYGSVYVAGMTLGQAKCVIEKYLSHYLQDPQIAVDVFAYNSKVYYVIYDGAGFGQQIFRLPATGNETVLDGISQVQGLAAVSSKKRIWVARPAPDDQGYSQILPVDWRAITEAGVTATNYQIFPGDRIYVDSNRLIEFDNYLSMVLAPIERMLGITLLGAFTVQAVRGQNIGGFGF